MPVGDLSRPRSPAGRACDDGLTVRPQIRNPCAAAVPLNDQSGRSLARHERVMKAACDRLTFMTHGESNFYWRWHMAERTLRGARLGGQSFEDERGIEFAARQQVGYACPQGHEFEITMSVEADVPAVWECPRCGAEALSLRHPARGEGREAGPHPLGHAARASLDQGARGHPQASASSCCAAARSAPRTCTAPTQEAGQRLRPADVARPSPAAHVSRRRPRPGPPDPPGIPVRGVRVVPGTVPRSMPGAPGRPRRRRRDHAAVSSRRADRPGERQDQQDAERRR